MIIMCLIKECKIKLNMEHSMARMDSVITNNPMNTLPIKTIIYNIIKQQSKTLMNTKQELNNRWIQLINEFKSLMIILLSKDNICLFKGICNIKLMEAEN